MNKTKTFNKICKDIKDIKIQGATNVAKQGFNAYQLIPNKSSIKKLLNLRPTEPMLYNLLKNYSYLTTNELETKLQKNQEKINHEVLKLIKYMDVIFTHCHASTVTKALIFAKKNKKIFEVYNTETRPLYQGRKTSLELKKAKIPVTQFVDSSALIAMTKTNNTKKVDTIFLGADAITKKGVYNKVGSGMYAQLAKINKIPFYIVTDSLKFSKNKIKIETRDKKEVWNKKSIKIINPAFEFIPKKLITGIVSELGTLSFKEFVREVRKRN
ncbi:hypothetical protein GOV12_04090 [Candidatus Pacearchaeota archaeon]|nr:hypothetical protein [Candidatus Pacearchaeota archaeon]